MTTKAKVLVFLFCIYMFTLPLTSAFALTSFMPIPLVVLLLLILFIYSFKGIDVFRSSMYADSKLIVLVIVALIIWSFIINFDTNNTDNSAKQIMHLLAYLTVFLVQFLFVKNMFSWINYNGHIVIVLRWLAYGVIFAALFSLIEFVGKNFIGFNVDEYIYRPAVNRMDALVGGYSFRSRSFVEEPGHYALFLELVSPIGFYYFKYHSRHLFLSWVYLILILISLLMTYSAAGVFCFFVGLIVTIIFFIFSRKSLSNVFLVILSLLFIVVLIIFFIAYFKIIDGSALIDTFVSKSAFEGASGQDRLDRYSIVQFIIGETGPIEFFFGNGPGSYYLLNIPGILMVYSLFFIDIGFVMFILFIFLLVHAWIKITSIRSDIKYFLIFGYVSGLTHYLVIGNFWYPWLWMLLGLSFAVASQAPFSPSVKERLI